ncbi:MAG: hypothetical protein H0W64_03375 [Gammaproteobacteria bacterium]|nr:hypothetical protein [Gammaproteobacteria bacterium]
MNSHRNSAPSISLMGAFNLSLLFFSGTITSSNAAEPTCGMTKTNADNSPSTAIPALISRETTALLHEFHTQSVDNNYLDYLSKNPRKDKKMLSAIADDKYLRETCNQTPSFQVVNKNKEIRLGIVNKKIMPSSCKDKNKYAKQCEEEIKAQLKISYQTSNLFNLRDVTQHETNDYALKMQARISQITANFTPKQTQAFEKSYQIFCNLYWQYKISKNTAKTGGACLESTMETAIKILQDQKFNYRLQTLRVRSAARNANNEPIYDHTFLFLSDKKIADFEIKSTAIFANGKVVKRDLEKENKQIKEVGQKLLTLKGYVCDRWNVGLFEEISQDTTGLYSPDAEWDEIRLKTLFYYNDLLKLPFAGYEFLREQYQLMEVNLPMLEQTTRDHFQKKSITR